MEYYQYYNFKHIHESDKNIVGTYLDLIKVVLFNDSTLERKNKLFFHKIIE